MSKTTRKVFLRQSTADDLKAVIQELSRARESIGDAQKVLRDVEAVVKKLQGALKLAENQPVPGYRSMPAHIRSRLRTLETKARETLEMVKAWAITPDERVLEVRTNKQRRRKGQ